MPKAQGGPTNQTLESEGEKKVYCRQKGKRQKLCYRILKATSVHTADLKSPRKAKSESDIFQYVLFKKTCKYPLKNIGK